MEELVIKTHSFEQSKNQLKKFSEENTADLNLRHVDSDKGMENFWVIFSGEEVGDWTIK